MHYFYIHRNMFHAPDPAIRPYITKIDAWRDCGVAPYYIPCIYLNSRSTTQWPQVGPKEATGTKQSSWSMRSVWYLWFGLSIQGIYYIGNTNIVVKQVTFFKILKSSKSVGKLFPIPVGVFCSLLEPPKCHMMQQIIDALHILINSRSTTQWPVC